MLDLVPGILVGFEGRRQLIAQAQFESTDLGLRVAQIRECRLDVPLVAVENRNRDAYLNVADRVLRIVVMLKTQLNDEVGHRLDLFAFERGARASYVDARTG